MTASRSYGVSNNTAYTTGDVYHFLLVHAISHIGFAEEIHVDGALNERCRWNRVGRSSRSCPTRLLKQEEDQQDHKPFKANVVPVFDLPRRSIADDEAREGWSREGSRDRVSESRPTTIVWPILTLARSSHCRKRNIFLVGVGRKYL